MATRVILEAFENVDPSVRLREIYLGVLPELEVDFESPNLPTQLRPFDSNGSLGKAWRLIGGLRRERVWTDVQKWIEEGVPSVELKQRLEARIASLQVPPAQPTEPSQPVSTTTEPFPKVWLAADHSGRMQRLWTSFTDAQRAQVRKFAKSAVTRTGPEAREELNTCFNRVKDLESQQSAAVSVPSDESSSEEETETVTRSVQEVMNVRLDRKKGGAVMIEVKNSSGREWVNAEKLLAPEVLVRLAQALSKIP